MAAPKFQFKNRYQPGSVKLQDKLKGNHSEWMVWWYAGIYKNPQDTHQPHCLVVFRQKDSDDWSLGTVYTKRVPLTWLGQLRIGSVWKNGLYCKETVLVEKKFDVDFTKGKWQFSSLNDTVRSCTSPPFPESTYPLSYPIDRSWLLEFPIDTGGKLVIPCLEFFLRVYGRSAEVNRVLATYPWEGADDSVMSRFFAPGGKPAEPGIWKVNLKKELVLDDAVLLAHIKYDTYAELAAKAIHSNLEIEFKKKSDASAFIPIGPWFQGPAKLRVEGIWFNNQKSFLALRVTGVNNPPGPPIHRELENHNTNTDSDLAPDQDGGKAGASSKSPSGLIELTGDASPDMNSAHAEIYDADFIILGEPREIVTVQRDKTNVASGSQRSGVTSSTTVFSAGDPHGSGTGVGQADIQAREVLESHGALRDIWKALLLQATKRPDLIKSVEWFTFDTGFKSDSEPELVGLKPLNPKDGAGKAIRNWVYLDIPTKKLRGLLVARVFAGGKSVFFVEIQRRPRTKKVEGGEKIKTEEPFSGMVFVLDDEKQFVPVLQEILSQVRYAKGIIDNLIGRCKLLTRGAGKAYAFRHTAVKDDTVACETAVMNALGKVGVR